MLTSDRFHFEHLALFGEIVTVEVSIRTRLRFEAIGKYTLKHNLRAKTYKAAYNVSRR